MLSFLLFLKSDEAEGADKNVKTEIDLKQKTSLMRKKPLSMFFVSQSATGDTKQ